MNTGDILSTGGFPVSKVTVEDLGYFDIQADGSLLNSNREFKLAYPSINNYIIQLDTDDLPAEGDAGYLATGAVVYANTTNFASTGTILIGKEKISYTSKEVELGLMLQINLVEITAENVVVDIISVGSGAVATAGIKKWRKDKFNKNKDILDSDNGYFFKNYVHF